MKKPRGFFGWARRVLGIVFLVGVVIFGYIAYKQGVVGMVHRQLTLPSCSNVSFSTLPTDLSDFRGIVPLGNINVPDHSTPTDHVYFYYANRHVAPRLVAPGHIVITKVEFHTESESSHTDPGDYAISFTPCRGLDMKFDHVKQLDGKVAKVLAGGKGSCQHNRSGQGIETTYCGKPTDLSLGAGEAIGVLGVHGQADAFDFGAYKSSNRDPGLADSSWLRSSAVCALDYFDAAAKKALYAKLERTAEPRCGQVGQDKPGTAQGAWSVDRKPGNWGGQLSLVHYNLDPGYGILAVGGTISQPLTIQFKTVGSGNINLEPSKTRTGTTYCYQSDRVDLHTDGFSADQHVLIKLTSAKTLQAEVLSGRCADGFQLVHPTTYYR